MATQSVSTTTVRMVSGASGHMRSAFSSEVEERFVRYARIDTQSDEASTTSPSTSKQFDLLRLLVDELRAIGAQEVTLTDYGAVLATLPATVATPVPPPVPAPTLGHPVVPSRIRLRQRWCLLI
jgi:hypothetical protein